MANELYIERPKGEIALAEWKSAANGVEGIKLCSSDGTIKNPKTGEVISAASAGVGAELYAPDCEKPLSLFLWNNGRISFKARPVNGEVPDHLWKAATSIASRLHAV